ncbi:MAG TPA: nuclear transport factor 2 family protein [Candidatus Stackebrandtia excrementipullorum]|nr:nuclear transport factor 2 family protein [Candidatus Stackebrandtia excrementipullorum]
MTETRLPPPVERLMYAVNESDRTGFLAEFTDDGVVDALGHRYVGRDEIRDWSDSASIGHQQTFTVKKMSFDGDVVTAVIDVTGNGYAGPSTFCFHLDGDRITEMRISELRWPARPVRSPFCYSVGRHRGLVLGRRHDSGTIMASCQQRAKGDAVADDEVLRALQQELQLLIRRSRLMTRELARAVHPRLDPSAYALVALLSSGQPRRVSEVAATLNQELSTVSRQIDVVERLGLVHRVSDPRDARAKLVSLTESGRETVSAQLAARRRLLTAQLGTWPQEDLVELTRLLHQLRESGIWDVEAKNLER